MSLTRTTHRTTRCLPLLVALLDALPLALLEAVELLDLSGREHLAEAGVVLFADVENGAAHGEAVEDVFLDLLIAQRGALFALLHLASLGLFEAVLRAHFAHRLVVLGVDLRELPGGRLVELQRFGQLLVAVLVVGRMRSVLRGLCHALCGQGQHGKHCYKKSNHKL